MNISLVSGAFVFSCGLARGAKSRSRLQRTEQARGGPGVGWTGQWWDCSAATLPGAAGSLVRGTGPKATDALNGDSARCAPNSAAVSLSLYITFFLPENT